MIKISRVTCSQVFAQFRIVDIKEEIVNIEIFTREPVEDGQVRTTISKLFNLPKGETISIVFQGDMYNESPYDRDTDDDDAAYRDAREDADMRRN